MKDINVCLLFFVAGTPEGSKEWTVERGQARDGAAAWSFSETLKPRCRRIATALENGERQYPVGA
jgi:hypothetical protein